MARNGSTCRTACTERGSMRPRSSCESSHSLCLTGARAKSRHGPGSAEARCAGKDSGIRETAVEGGAGDQGRDWAHICSARGSARQFKSSNYLSLRYTPAMTRNRSSKEPPDFRIPAISQDSSGQSAPKNTANGSPTMFLAGRVREDCQGNPLASGRPSGA